MQALSVSAGQSLDAARRSLGRPPCRRAALHLRALCGCAAEALHGSAAQAPARRPPIRHRALGGRRLVRWAPVMRRCDLPSLRARWTHPDCVARLAPCLCQSCRGRPLQLTCRMSARHPGEVNRRLASGMAQAIPRRPRRALHQAVRRPRRDSAGRGHRSQHQWAACWGRVMICAPGANLGSPMRPCPRLGCLLWCRLGRAAQPPRRRCRRDLRQARPESSRRRSGQQTPTCRRPRACLARSGSASTSRRAAAASTEAGRSCLAAVRGFTTLEQPARMA
mmetsp:Transcript_39915/g.105183  ORF Transcript_39915/g.105183 Transcript_39915/m.105183 type:complete len:279 (-) Transcript_39915:93-929(-)